MTVSSSSTSSSVHLYESAYFFLTFSEDLDIFLGDKLQASTAYTLQLLWRGRNDAKSQKNWALGQIRKFPDTIGYMWTAVNDSNTLRVDAKIFATAKKYLRKKKFPDTCGHGLKYCGIRQRKIQSLASLGWFRYQRVNGDSFSKGLVKHHYILVFKSLIPANGTHAAA